MTQRGLYVEDEQLPELTAHSFGPWKVLDDLGNYVPVAALGSLLLTLHVDARDNAAQPIINSVDHDEILSTTRAQLIDSGSESWFTLRLLSGDMPILNPSLSSERHVATLLGTYNGGTGQFTFEVQFTVRNAAKAP